MLYNRVLYAGWSRNCKRRWRRFPTPGLCFSGWQPRSAWIDSRRFSPLPATRLFVH